MSQPEPKSKDELMAIAEAVAKLDEETLKALEAQKADLMKDLDPLNRSVVQSFAQGIKQMNARR